MEILASLFGTIILSAVIAFLVWKIGNVLDKH